MKLEWDDFIKACEWQCRLAIYYLNETPIKKKIKKIICKSHCIGLLESKEMVNNVESERIMDLETSFVNKWYTQILTPTSPPKKPKEEVEVYHDTKELH